MKTFNLFCFFLLLFSAVSAQTGVKGTIKDVASGEPLIGVNIILASGKGTVTDTSGKFFIQADSGTYTVQITYIGYLTQTAKVKVVRGKSAVLNLGLESRTLTAVEVVADIAKTRETPVAFTNIDAKKIEEELASRDIPMLLASTPGVYATQGGGGLGDGRMTMRGFDQTNIGVLVDGIPTNDMENGAVYWSDWAGLGDITRNIQIQRGLGASKLAISSVGGTVNIITKGIDAKPSISYSQEYGTDMMLKEQLCATTGRMKGDWGLTVAGSRKTGDGWVDQTPYSMWSYFVKAEKRIKNHTISISANSAPQTHEQRSYNQFISTFDKSYAQKLGVNLDYYPVTSPSATGNYGITYNQLWGNIDRWSGNVNKYGIIQGDTLSHNKSILNTKVNYFNKPLYNLNDYWTINDKLYLSTVFYVSTGSGGGTTLNSSGSTYMANGQLNLQSIYNANYTSQFGITTLAPGRNASSWIYNSVNNHEWVGGLSTLTYKPNNTLTLTVGPDLRWYKGSHYYQVRDLLGADYMVDYGNQHNNYTANPSLAVRRVGDIYGRDYDDYVKYGGGFLQAEYVKNKLSVFATGTFVQTSYQRIDQFDSSKGHISPLMEYYGYTTKAGANYNINEHHNVFFNAGYIVKAPPFANVFDYTNIPCIGADNQKIATVELGYGFKSRYIAANINGYYTDWKNRPLQYPIAITLPSGDVLYGNINGMNALHKGVEMDFQAKPLDKVTIGGIAMLADWRWNSSGLARINDAQGKLIDTVRIDAKGVHVANAPQTQFGLNIRYEPFKRLYVKLQWTYFARQYAQFTPEQLNPNTNPYFHTHPGIDAWRVPNYQLVDLHVGYKFRFYNHWELNLAAHVLNLFNTEYIADATNGSFFDATTSMVYFGQPRSFLVSMKLSFN